MPCLGKKELMAKFGVETTTFKHIKKLPGFPEPVRVYGQTDVWLTEEIKQWLINRRGNAV